MSAPNKQDLERVVLEAQQQIQMQAQQALMEKMNTICFRRCVPSPMEVGDRQRRCLQQCVGAFLEGWGVAVRCKAGAALLSYTFMRARVAGCGRRAPRARGARLRAPSLAARACRVAPLPFAHPATTPSRARAERNVRVHREKADGRIGRRPRVSALRAAASASFFNRAPFRGARATRFCPHFFVESPVTHHVCFQ